MIPVTGELRQLRYKNQPWRVLVICMLLNRTRGKQMEEIAEELFKRWPTADLMYEANQRELEEIVRPLGMWKARARHLKLMSARYSTAPPRTRADVELLPGIGKYGADAWEIVCCGNLAVEPTDRELLRYVQFARALTEDTG